MTVPRKIGRNPEFVHRKVGDEEVLVPVRRTGTDLSAIYLLNAVASEIWGRLENSRSEEDLLDHVVSRFEVDRDVAAGDLARFLEELRTLGALVEEESG